MKCPKHKIGMQKHGNLFIDGKRKPFYFCPICWEKPNPKLWRIGETDFIRVVGPIGPFNKRSRV